MLITSRILLSSAQRSWKYKLTTINSESFQDNFYLSILISAATVCSVTGLHVSQLFACPQSNGWRTGPVPWGFPGNPQKARREKKRSHNLAVTNFQGSGVRKTTQQMPDDFWLCPGLWVSFSFHYLFTFGKTQ